MPALLLDYLSLTDLKHISHWLWVALILPGCLLSNLACGLLAILPSWLPVYSDASISARKASEYWEAPPVPGVHEQSLTSSSGSLGLCFMLNTCLLAIDFDVRNFPLYS